MGILPCEAWLPLINWYPRALNYILLHKPHTSKDPVPRAMFWCWDLQILNSLGNMNPENYVPDPGYMILDVPWPPDGWFSFSMTTRLVSGWLTTPGSWDRKTLTLKWETKEESRVITTMTSLESGPGTPTSGAMHVLRTSLVQDTEGHSKVGSYPGQARGKSSFQLKACGLNPWDQVIGTHLPAWNVHWNNYCWWSDQPRTQCVNLKPCYVSHRILTKNHYKMISEKMFVRKKKSMKLSK